jgi:hypothetical protein
LEGDFVSGVAVASLPRFPVVFSWLAGMVHSPVPTS